MMIFLLAIITLISLIVVLYVYIRCRRSIDARRRRNAPLFFYNEAIPMPSINIIRGGLDPSIINSLPVFIHSDSSPLECSVCLSDFREGEKGKKLPECGHSFHVGCINKWLCSHLNCPLCRSKVFFARKEEDDEREITTGSVLDASSSSAAPIAPAVKAGEQDLESGDVSRIND